MSEDSKTVIKRVTISNDNMTRLERLAENKNMKLSQCLDDIVCRAIIEEEKKDNMKTPFYIWKS